MSLLAITYGAVHAVTLPPTRDGSMWAHIAVVNRPGAPLRYDPHCPPGTIYFVNKDALKWRMLSNAELQASGVYPWVKE